eukprot:961737-Rhodomonas_salina.1
MWLAAQLWSVGVASRGRVAPRARILTTAASSSTDKQERQMLSRKARKGMTEGRRHRWMDALMCRHQCTLLGFEGCSGARKGWVVIEEGGCQDTQQHSPLRLHPPLLPAAARAPTHPPPLPAVSAFLEARCGDTDRQGGRVEQKGSHIKWRKATGRGRLAG